VGYWATSVNEAGMISLNTIGSLMAEEKVFRVQAHCSCYHFKYALVRGLIYNHTLIQEKYRLHKATCQYFNLAKGVRSTVLIRRIEHHHKKQQQYVAFKPAS
jgi:hypothetical protein